MSSQRGMVNLTTPTTTQEHTLGALHVSETGDHYRYMQADGAVTSYHLYNYTADDWQIDAIATETSNPSDTDLIPTCVWDQSATALADNEYAWVFVGPGTFTCTAEAGGALAVNEIVYLDGETAGTLSATAGPCFVPGVVALAAISAAATGSIYATHGLYLEDTA